MKARRKRKAMAVVETGGFLIRFIPGGFYHYSDSDGQLFTGVHRRTASQKITDTLLPLAQKAITTPNQWVTM